MSTSFIKYNEFGFWSEDSDTQVLCGFLFYTYSVNKSKYKRLKEYINHIKLVSLGYYNSYIHFEFEKFFEEKDFFECFKLLLEDTIDLIDSYKGENIDLSFLNEVVFEENNEYIWNIIFKKKTLIELIEKFNQLANLTVRP